MFKFIKNRYTHNNVIIDRTINKRVFNTFAVNANYSFSSKIPS